MKTIQTYTALLMVCLIVAACNKYKAFNGEGTISGYAYLADSTSEEMPVPLTGQAIYLNTGSDSSTYLYEVKTDKAGFFSFDGLVGEKKVLGIFDDKKHYIIFTRFVKEGVEYKGSLKIEASELDDKTASVTLNVYPAYANGMIIKFADTLEGALPNLPFRMYASRLAAVADSAKYATADTVTSAQGTFSLYNIKAAKYYFVAKDSIGGAAFKVFDSTTVTAETIKKDTVYLRQQ